MRRLLMACLLLLAAPASAGKMEDLAQALRGSSSHRVRTQAALVLGDLGDRAAVPILLQALSDPSDAVRGASATALGVLGDPAATPALDRLSSDPSSYVRGAAARARERISARGKPPAGAARYRVAVNVRKGAGESATLLRDALLTRLSRLPGVATDGAAPANWGLEGSITSLKVNQGQLDCDVSLAIVTLPGGAIRATTTAGASLTGVNSTSDTRAVKDCFGGAADELADQVAAFLRRQP
jgi:hypothetical protein